MKKPYTYLALIILVFLACIPPINFFLSLPPMDIWFLLILLAGFAGIFTVFIKTDWPIKAIAIGSFIMCFFSSSAPISFTSYVSVMLVCYFYICCTRIEDWTIIFKAFQTLVFLNILLMVMQVLGHDELLNFGLGKEFTCFGVIGHHMQMGSFSVILSAALLPFCAWNLLFPFVVAGFCTSTWTFISAAAGCSVFLFRFNRKLALIFLTISLIFFGVWSFKHDKFSSNTVAENGRTVVWQKSLKYAMQRPLTGWGIGTYKITFPALGMTALKDIPYKSAHNWIIQLLFETGIPFTVLILAAIGILFYRLIKVRGWYCISGLLMMLCDGMVHFPERMMQSIGIIVCFLAYCTVVAKSKRCKASA